MAGGGGEGGEGGEGKTLPCVDHVPLQGVVVKSDPPGRYCRSFRVLSKALF